MDRQIVYPGAIPLETDLLNTNKNAMIGLGKLAEIVLGATTSLNGLACTAHAPANLTVDVGVGEIYSLQNIDGTAYSSLAADTSHQILKQGLKLDASNLACPAPATAGHSINYLIQVAYQDTDTGSVVLPYYNAANPTTAYSGPANSGAAQNTVRSGVCAVNVKAGISAITGTQTTPAPDAGCIAAYVVTVANGQTAISSANISSVAGAPFFNTTKTGATGLIRSLLSAGGALIREWGAVANAANVGGIKYGKSYNCAVDTTTGVWAGRDVADVCWLEKWSDAGVVNEVWYSMTGTAGSVPVWKCAWSFDPSSASNTIIGSESLFTNGNFDVWQQGTSFTNVTPATDFSYTADLWGAYRTGSVAGCNVSRVAGISGNTTYAAKVQRTAGDASTAAMKFDYNVPSKEIVPLLGRTISLSFDALKGANFSGTNLSCSITFGIGTVDRGLNGGATWTAGLASTAVVPSTSAGRFVLENVSVPANATKACVSFSYTPSGTAGADDSFTIGRFRGEMGKCATYPKDRNPQEELRRCMAYFQSYDVAKGNFTAPVPAFYSYGGAAQVVAHYPSLSILMDKTPVITKIGTWTVSNCAQPTLAASPQYASFATTATAAGAVYFTGSTTGCGYSLDARITA